MYAPPIDPITVDDNEATPGPLSFDSLTPAARRDDTSARSASFLCSVKPRLPSRSLPNQSMLSHAGPYRAVPSLARPSQADARLTRPIHAVPAVPKLALTRQAVPRLAKPSQS
jgi:hypothetical protein